MQFDKILASLSPSAVRGDIIQLKTSLEKHWNGIPPNKPGSESTSLNFAEALNRALVKVNDQQVDSENLMQRLVSDPKSVNVHDVLVTAEKARMSLNFTKSVTDLAIRTYRELVNLR